MNLKREFIRLALLPALQRPTVSSLSDPEWVAINRGVVPRSTFDTQRVAAGDRVEILEAVGGG